MARRIEIELTSAQPDGQWTWRAAGARQPRGVLAGGLLYDGAKTGDVLKAEAEFEIEGITIVSVTAPKEKTRPEPQRIEILGSGGPEAPGVTTQLVGRTDRRPGERRRDRDEGRPRRDREGPRSPSGRDASRPRRDSPAADRNDPLAAPTTPGKEGDHPNAPPRRPGRSERRDHTERPSGPTGRPQPAPGGPARNRDAPARRSERPARQSVASGASEEATGERRARRFNPGHTHRHAVMASLAPEEQPVAEQILRGGIPAVRTALHLEREKAIAAGRSAPNTDQLIAMAETLLPRLKAAEWRDRAEAAAKDVDEITLRDLRSVVAGADSARDDETRSLAASLRDALERRVDAQRVRWSTEVAAHLDENRVVRALRLAARPPEPAARLDAELTERLSEAAGQAMAPDTPAERWLALLDAVGASPIRRSVKPAGLPSDPSPELRRATHQQSGRIPALAAMLGIAIPPPPIPAAPRRPTLAPKGPAGRGNQRPRPQRQEREITPEASAAAQSPAYEAAAAERAPDETELSEPPAGEPASAESGQYPVVVEELGEAVGEV